MDSMNNDDRYRVPLSEVGYAGHRIEENMQSNKASTSSQASNLLQNMEMLLTRLLATQTQPTSSPPTQLIQYDPDCLDADIEGWCKVTEIIIDSKKLEGAELLLLLTHALKGRAASCLTKLQASQLTWLQIKEILLAKFAKPMLPQDYFDDVLCFQIGLKETGCEAAIRLWSIIERIPRTEMAEDIITGFVASVLSQKDAMIRRELHSHNIATRSQLFRILNGISLKRRYDDTDNQEIAVKRTRFNETRFTETCHRCGVSGHRAMDCCRNREESSFAEKTPMQSSRIPDKTRVITCFVCGQTGHLASTCPERKEGSNALTVKEVNVCERKSSMSTSTTSPD